MTPIYIPNYLPWIKTPVDFSRSEQLQKLSEIINEPTYVIDGIWKDICSQAGKATPRGIIPDLDLSWYAKISNGNLEVIKKVYDAVRKYGWILPDGRLNGWDELQTPPENEKTEAEARLEKIREGNRRRQNKYRAKHGKAPKTPRLSASAQALKQPVQKPKPGAMGCPAAVPSMGQADASISQGPAAMDDRPVPAPSATSNSTAGCPNADSSKSNPKIGKWAYDAWAKIEKEIWARNNMHKAKQTWLRLCASGRVTEAELPDVRRGCARMAEIKPLREAAGIAMPDPAEWIGGMNWRDEKLNAGWDAELAHWQRRATDAQAASTAGESSSSGQFRAPQTFDQRRRESNAATASRSASRVAAMQMQVLLQGRSPAPCRVQETEAGGPAGAVPLGLDAPRGIDATSADAG